MHGDVAAHCTECEPCQKRKTSHRPPLLPMGHIPVTRPFQRVAIDLVEYKTISQGCKYVLSVIDHMTRFVILTAIENKTAEKVVRTLIERVFSVFGVPDILHSDQGKEFENQLVKELQSVLGYEKSRTTPYRPQGNSVLERVHSTLHNMLAMYCDVGHSNWAELLPFVQMAHNTAYNTVHETPHYSMFGRMPTLPIDIIMGLPRAEVPVTALQYTHKTVENLRFAYELARQNLGERADNQAASNAKLTFKQIKAGDLVLIHQPHVATDDPNNKLLSPWRGPYQVRSRLSVVVYRVSKPGESAENSVHLARMKSFYPRDRSTEPDMEQINSMFLGTLLPEPDLDNAEESVYVGRYIVVGIVAHKGGAGRPSPFNVQLRFRRKKKPASEDKWIHRRQLPSECNDMVTSYF